MTFFLIIVTGILGILGILTKPHFEIEKNGQQIQRISNFGYITIVLLILSTIGASVKQLKDDKISEIKSVSKIPDDIVGPKFILEISSNDDIEICGTPNIEEQSKNAYNSFLKNSKGRFDTSDGFWNWVYRKSFLDSCIRNKIFNDAKFSELHFEVGFLKVNVQFRKDGLILAESHLDENIVEILSNNDHTKVDMVRVGYIKQLRNGIEYHGGFDRPISSETFLNQIVEDNINGDETSSMSIYFDDYPTYKQMGKINTTLNNIKGFTFRFTYGKTIDFNIVIPYNIESGYTFEGKRKDSWVMTKKIILTEKPYIDKTNQQL